MLGAVAEAPTLLSGWCRRHPAARQPRAERGLSQERLAELAQMHRTYLGGIETARRNLSFKNLFRLARALGVSLADLFETVG
jgi:transcriptional regulator with XRE-family HTH domain